MSIDTKWFRSQLAERGLSQRALARQLGLDQSAISLTFSGKRTMKFREAADIARLFTVPVQDVLRHAGVPIDQGEQTVPISSIYDGHGESRCIGLEGDRVVVPFPMPPGSTAIQCQTASSPLEHMDGWILFCHPPVADPIPLGQFCKVHLRRGVAVLGVVRKGYKPARYTVAGPAGIITDADIEWVSVIAAIRTNSD